LADFCIDAEGAIIAVSVKGIIFKLMRGERTVSRMIDVLSLVPTSIKRAMHARIDAQSIRLSSDGSFLYIVCVHIVFKISCK
jgi:hypothetical protein